MLQLFQTKKYGGSGKMGMNGKQRLIQEHLEEDVASALEKQEHFFETSNLLLFKFDFQM